MYYFLQFNGRYQRPIFHQVRGSIYENSNPSAMDFRSAYYKAQARRFAPGKALNDWLMAENDYAKMKIAHYLSVAEEDGGMTILSLQQLAKELGVENPESIHQKIELIQFIQAASQHRPCFRSISEKDCHEEDCQWRAECKKMIAAWYRH